MSKEENRLDQFRRLTWNDLEYWAGETIVNRGKNYQRQGRVADLAVTADGSLIAWVKGSARYATRVLISKAGRTESICTCPYGLDCKHAVAVVLEYLNRVKNNRSVSKAEQDDERQKLLDGDGVADEAGKVISENTRQDIAVFLKGKTKAQLVELINELAGRYQEVSRELSDRRALSTGDLGALIRNLRNDIQNLSDEPGWRNHWSGEGYTPDYTVIRQKLELLLKAGHADEVLALGRELITAGTRQVEESQDEGETAMEIADCMPMIIEALERSSLGTVDKLAFALNAVLEDQYEICDDFAAYLNRQHPQTAWHTLADRLLMRLQGLKGIKKTGDFSRNYERDRLSDWAIRALERAGREEEVIPLCIAEAKLTCSYERLVKRLVKTRRYEDAKKWIKEGLRNLGAKWPGITASLRQSMQEILSAEHNWPGVAAIKVEEFVRHPSPQGFSECKKASNKAEVWPKVRISLLSYLETGKLPWKQEGWPLPESGLDMPGSVERNQFPLLDELIDIAMLEKKPDQVLRWYDQRPKGGFRWFQIDEDAVATAVKTHAPDRAVAIWKNKAEGFIAKAQPKAYQEAAKYLKKAGEVMSAQKQQAQWEQYLKSLRLAHARKSRLLEILDSLEKKPIMKNRL